MNSYKTDLLKGDYFCRIKNTKPYEIAREYRVSRVDDTHVYGWWNRKEYMFKHDEVMLMARHIKNALSLLAGKTIRTQYSIGNVVWFINDDDQNRVQKGKVVEIATHTTEKEGTRILYTLHPTARVIEKNLYSDQSTALTILAEQHEILAKHFREQAGKVQQTAEQQDS